MNFLRTASSIQVATPAGTWFAMNFTSHRDSNFQAAAMGQIGSIPFSSISPLCCEPRLLVGFQRSGCWLPFDSKMLSRIFMLFAFRAYWIWAHTHTKLSENRDTSGSRLRLLVYMELSLVPRIRHKLLYLPVVFFKLKSRRKREKGVLFQVTQVPEKSGIDVSFWPTMMQKQVQNCGGGG